jgi:tetratricopeptide (TPR) repeat protein
LANLGQTSEAIAHYREAKRLKPGDPLILLNFAILLAEKRQLSDAIEQFMAVLKVAPLDCQARLNLAQALKQQGQTPQALIQYRTALHLAPTWPEALHRFALVLATHHDARFRDGPTAVRLAETANELTHQNNVLCLNTLAAAYAEVSRFDEAVATEQQALDLALASGRKGLTPQIENSLLLYKARKPYHEGE